MGAQVERAADVREPGAPGAHQRHRAGGLDGRRHPGQVGLAQRTVLQVEDHVVRTGSRQQFGGHHTGEQAPYAVGRPSDRPP
jgi:hypothetical protein